MPREGIQVLSEKENAFFFPTEEEEIDGDEKIIRHISAISEHVERRKNIVKFTKLEVPIDIDEVSLIPPNQVRQAQQAEEEIDDEEMKGEEREITCNLCGEKGHFFFNCPNKEIGVRSEEKKVTQGTDVYVPIHQRRMETGEERYISIRVANIPDGVDETVIKALFHKLVGNERDIRRLTFGKNRYDNSRADYCFIQVETKELAEKTIKAFDGYLLQYAKLSCDFARRANK